MCVQDGMKYGDLFAHLLKSFGILCIGLYRFRDTATSVEQNPCAKRYVITNPPADFKLLASDKVSYVKFLSPILPLCFCDVVCMMCARMSLIIVLISCKEYMTILHNISYCCYRY